MPVFLLYKKYGIDVPHEGIGTNPKEITDEEIEDPYLAGKFFDTPDCKMSKPVDTDKALNVSSDPRVKKSKVYAYKITVSEDDVLRVCIDIDSSPATLFTLLMAKSLYEKTMSEHVICAIATNLRPALKTPKSHYDTVNDVHFEYDKA